MHGRRSDRCLTTDSHTVLSSKPRHGLLLPITETSGIQAFFPDKTYIALIMLQSSIVSIIGQLVRTFHVLDLEFISAMPSPRPAGSV